MLLREPNLMSSKECTVPMHGLTLPSAGQSHPAERFSQPRYLESHRAGTPRTIIVSKNFSRNRGIETLGVGIVQQMGIKGGGCPSGADDQCKGEPLMARNKGHGRSKAKSKASLRVAINVDIPETR